MSVASLTSYNTTLSSTPAESGDDSSSPFPSSLSRLQSREVDINFVSHSFPFLFLSFYGKWASSSLNKHGGK